MLEGTIDLEAGVSDLKELGTAGHTVSAVSAALAKVPSSLIKAKTWGGALSGLGTKS
jgi:hypothetical protein